MTAIDTIDSTSSSVDSTSGSTGYKSSYAADQVPYVEDPILYMILVSIDAQNSDQECMSTLTETLQYMSEAGVSGVESGTALLEADNQVVQRASGTDNVNKAQSQEQVDSTKINNMNQQFSNLTQSLENGVNALNTSDQNESEFIKSVLGVYDNVVNLISSAA